MRSIVAINCVDFRSEHKRKSQDLAMDILSRNSPRAATLASVNFCNERVNVPPNFHVLPMLRKDSKEKLGNDRRMPYVKEILDICSSMPCDVFGYMNSDILIQKDFYQIFKKDISAYVFYKRDIESLSASDFLAGKIKIVDERPDGVDAFFFSREWWFAHRRYFPDDLVLGETEWDTCYNAIIQKVAKKYLLKRSLYHIHHDRIWTLDSKAALNNLAIWQNVKNEYGCPEFVPETRSL